MERSRQFLLFLQHPKIQEMGSGILSVDRHGEALFFSGNGQQDSKVVAMLKRVRIDSASADGLMLSGMEPAGSDRQGRETFKYQEWWLSYPPA